MVEEYTSKQCCGCGLCVEICPNNAISLHQDDHGFLHPIVNKDMCIGCKKCVQNCTYNCDSNFSNSIGYYIGCSQDKNTRITSSSGGIFDELAKHILKNQGIVIAASFNDSFMVVHTCSNSEEQKNKQKKSKYVQSDFSNAFKYINCGKTCLVVGTPCQIDAIKNYCRIKKIEQSNLIFCDLICHGVSSPLIWKEYLTYISNLLGDSITDINFRNKQYGYGYNMLISSVNTVYEKKEEKDPFIDMFIQNLVLRKSCLNCKYKIKERVSDITIGDARCRENLFWGEMSKREGVSCILVNSEKGEKLIDEIKDGLLIRKVEYKDITQPNISGGVAIDENKIDSFFSFYHKYGFEKALKKYTEIGIKNRTIRNVKRFIKRCMGIFR